MNTLTDCLSPGELYSMRAVAVGLLVDVDTGFVITYRQSTGHVYDPAAGVSADTETATELTCWLAPVDLREVMGARTGDIKALVTTEDVTSPRVDDRWTDADGVTWAVYAVQSGPVSAYSTCYAHRVI